jgi:hypothetical protein
LFGFLFCGEKYCDAFFEVKNHAMKFFNGNKKCDEILLAVKNYAMNFYCGEK